MGRRDEAEARPAGGTERARLATISLQPRQSGGSTESSSRRRRPSRTIPASSIVRLSRANALAKGQAPTRRRCFRPTYSRVTTRPPAGLRPRDLAPAARARGAPLGRPGLPQARDRQPPGRAARRRAPRLPAGARSRLPRRRVRDGARAARDRSAAWCAPTSAWASRGRRGDRPSSPTRRPCPSRRAPSTWC